MNRIIVMRKKLLLIIMPILLLCNIISIVACEKNKETDALNAIEKAILYYYPFSSYTILYEDEYIKSICILKLEIGKKILQENLFVEKIISIKNREGKNTKKFNANVLIEFIDGNGCVLLSVVLGGDYFLKIDDVYYDLTESDYEFFRTLLPPVVEADFEQLKNILDNRNAPPLPSWNPFEILYEND